jgi:septum formation protein
MNNESLATQLILASSSKYRKLLLQRLGICFDCIAPEIDETPLENEKPVEIVHRLATQKARTVSESYPAAVVIGSDQVAEHEDRIIGKAGSYENAVEQLMSFSDRSVNFHTAVSVQHHETSFSETFTDTTTVDFRALHRAEVVRYLQTEKPFDCAGSFKAESLGIVLFERIVSDDPTALVGLPLIRTSASLRRAGFQLP